VVAEAKRWRIRDVILALVAMHPGTTGYDLRAVIRDSTSYLFDASLSQIYPALKELHGAGLIEFETVEVTGGPSRKLYSVTPEGTEILTAMLAEPIDFPPNFGAFRLLLLRLALMGSSETSEIQRICGLAREHFRAEQQRITAGGIDPAGRYLLAAPVVRRGFEQVWKPELAFMLDDLQRKIDWIEALMVSLAEEESSSQS